MGTRASASSSAVLAALACLAGAGAGTVALAGCGEAQVGDPVHAGGISAASANASVGSPAGTSAAAPGTGPRTGTAATGGETPSSGTGTAPAGATPAHGVAREVTDPEEARSFPQPATIHHASASTPSVAGEAAVAAGAASDAEIRKELGEEEKIKAQERAARRRLLAPAVGGSPGGGSSSLGGSSVGGDGTIPIPTNVPEAVQRVVAGGNAIADFPYIWGGGHASFVANGYDCSGSVSYALAAGGLLSAPLVSGELASWGDPGPGRWITIYANAGHTFMNVAGVWFDTAGRSGPYASRWILSTPPLAGYAVRHPPGL